MIDAPRVRLALLCAALCVVLALSGLSRNALPQETDPQQSLDPAPAAGSEAAKATEEGAVAGRKHPETYLEFAIAGGYLMIPIGLCSILVLAFFIERITSTRRNRVLPRSFERAIERIGRSPEASFDVREVESICSAHPSSASRVLKAALAKAGEQRDEIESSVNSAAQREIFELRRHTWLFAFVAAVAPLIGLLGTVTGMIQAFREVAIQGLGSGQALAPGIYKALITTAGGLLVAIPAITIYWWFRARIQKYVNRIDTLVVDFVEANRLISSRR